MFPNLASPRGRNTQGGQSIPGIPVLCFLPAWTKALASHGCKQQQEVWGHLAFSKPEVQDCWLLTQNFGTVIRFFGLFCFVLNFSWLQRLQYQLSSQPRERSGLMARAQPWWSSGKSAEALPGFQFHSFHSKIIFPCSFPLFPSTPFFHAAL